MLSGRGARQMVKITGWFTKANPRKWTFGQKLCEAATKLFPYMGIISEMLECTIVKSIIRKVDGGGASGLAQWLWWVGDI